MTTSTYPPSGTANQVTGQTSIDNFIPELWSDEIIASFKSNLVAANCVSEIAHQGKKGDTIHIPSPSRDAANQKVEATAVTVISNVEGTTPITIDQHWEYTRLIEDIAGLQAINSYRNFYTDDAGYALGQRVDREVLKRVHYLQGGNGTPAAANLFEAAVIGGDGSTTFDHTAGTNVGNGTTFTDAGIRTIIQGLDDADVPMSERYLIIPPVEKKTLMGIPRYTEQAFVGEGGSGNTIRNGLVGELYGVMIYVSTNCPWVHVNSVTGTASVTFTSAAPTGASFSDDFSIAVDWSTSTPTDTKYRIASLIHKSAIVHVPQQGVRTQTQYKQEYLADLFTADVVFGTAELRDDAGYGIAVPA
jgi:hypothetical protein